MPKSQPTIFPVCQANDWFYVYTSATGEKAIDRVAVWARVLSDVEPDGVTVGLIAVRHDAGVTPALIIPPTSEGCYVHFEDLSAKEKQILESYRKPQA